MSDSNSIQHKLSRNRPPRVQITYDVETGGALERKELPFIVGILADLSRSSTIPKKPISQKKPIQIDRDNFNKVMKSIEPRVDTKVTNTLEGDVSANPTKLSINIPFTNIDHFNPIYVVENVPKLNTLYGKRSRLRDFLSKLDGNDALTEILADIHADSTRKSELISTVGKANKDGALDKLREQKRQGSLSDDAFEDKINTLFKVAFDENGELVGDIQADIKLMLKEGQLYLEGRQIPYALELIVEFVEQVLSEPDASASSDTATTNSGTETTEASADDSAGTSDAVADAAASENAQSDDPAASEEVSFFNAVEIILKLISRLDSIISRQLNYIMHDNAFQECEATWRGLHFLVMNTETSTKLKLKVLDVSRDELFNDLDRAVDYDQSTLFKIIYEEEYGTFGGEPYSVLVGDYQFGRNPQDIKFLEMLSGVAAAAHAPFIANADSELFDLSAFEDLHKPRDLSKIFDSAELIQWRAFREKEDSRYITLTLPRVMLRLPYHNIKNPIDGIYFDEDVAITILDDAGNPVMKADPHDASVSHEKTRKAVDASKILWGNPAFVLGQRITNAFALHGWTAAIRGVEGGGLVEGLPAYTFETEDGDVALNCPTEVSITDRREKELDDLGFMAICHCKGTNKAAFFGGQSTNSPKQYLTDSATANAKISAMLPYVLSASRFAHYIKVLMREKIGSFMTRQNVEKYLNTWIAQYVLLDDTPPQHIKAKYPLREARIDVTDVPGKPGSYRATVFLRPHFQLEELSTSIRLVADLPS